jgi:hypothetical protein
MFEGARLRSAVSRSGFGVRATEPGLIIVTKLSAIPLYLHGET